MRGKRGKQITKIINFHQIYRLELYGKKRGRGVYGRGGCGGGRRRFGNGRGRSGQKITSPEATTEMRERR